jgi:hypothetical protein
LKKLLTTSIPPTDKEELTIRSIKKEISKENLIVTKADMVNSLAILENKVIQFIDNSESITLKNDSTQKFNLCGTLPSDPPNFIKLS